MSTPKKKAEQFFSAGQRRDEQVLKGKEKAAQARADKMARLRVLRLAKEAEDRKTTDRAATSTDADTNKSKTDAKA